MNNQTIINELREIKHRVDGLLFDLEQGNDDKPEWLPSCINYKGETIPVPQDWITQWETMYPRGMVLGCIRDAAAWSLDNPGKRKKDLRRFLGSWIKRKAEKMPMQSSSEGFGGNYERLHHD